MDGYVEDVNFCEYCGNILNEGGRCPDEECVWNLLLDVMSDTEEETPVDVEEEDTTPTEEGESAADNAIEDDAEVTEESSETTSVEEQTEDVATKEEPSEGDA